MQALFISRQIVGGLSRPCWPQIHNAASCGLLWRKISFLPDSVHYYKCCCQNSDPFWVQYLYSETKLINLLWGANLHMFELAHFNSNKNGILNPRASKSGITKAEYVFTLLAFSALVLMAFLFMMHFFSSIF